MTSRATIGECAINQVPITTNQGFKNFVPFENTDVEFFYYLLTTQKQRFLSMCGGSTFLEISKTQLIVFEVRVPPTVRGTSRYRRRPFRHGCGDHGPENEAQQGTPGQNRA